MKLLVLLLWLGRLACTAYAFTNTHHRHRAKTSTAILSVSSQPTASPSKVLDMSQDGLALFSPCKINLFLRILRKRPDNYHDLASLFQTISFGDTLYLKLSTDEEEDELECNMEGVPTDKTNLVLRALDLMRKKTGTTDTFFKANLIKQVPAQAGLGGGSGNAAAAMWGANELLGRPANLDQLVEWSAELGSDITFFLSPGTAYCTGRGEIMTPVSPMKDGTKLCIVKPDIGLSTPEVFRALKYDKLSTIDPKVLLQRFMDYGVDGNNRSEEEKDEVYAYVNDLEKPAFDCVPELKTLKEELLTIKGFQHVLMSGSGTSFFCIGEAEDMDGFLNDFGGREGVSVFPAEFISRKEGQWFESKKS